MSNCACMSPRVKYRKGPYLLLVRGILEKGDTVIQEEIKLMRQFLGDAICEIIVVIATLPKWQSKKMSCFKKDSWNKANIASCITLSLHLNAKKVWLFLNPLFTRFHQRIIVVSSSSLSSSPYKASATPGNDSRLLCSSSVQNSIKKSVHSPVQSTGFAPTPLSPIHEVQTKSPLPQSVSYI